MPPNDGEIDAEIAGQKISLRNISINTAATVLTLIAVSLIGYGLWMHNDDTKRASHYFGSAIKEQTGVMKEQIVVTREQNCLLRFDQKDRPLNADFCKRISQ